MASTLRVNTLEPYTGTDITIDADIIVNGDKTISGNLIVTGSVSVPRLLSVTSTQNLGTDASGSNAAATNFTQVAPLSTGNATPAALVWQVGVQGASGSTPQTATEAFRVQEIASISGRTIAAFVNGRALLGLDSTFPSTLVPANPGAVVNERVRVYRAAGIPFHGVFRVNGSYASPTVPLANEFLGQFIGGGWDGSDIQFGSNITIVARENWSGTARGSLVRVQAVDVTTTAAKSLLDFRGGGTNVAEIVAQQSTLRIIPGATEFAVRDSGNTANTFQGNAAGTAWYFPIATAVGIGHSSNNAAALLQLDSTTRGFLPPRMTEAQRDAIGTPPAGLMIYNTSTNKLNVYTTAWEQVTSA